MPSTVMRSTVVRRAIRRSVGLFLVLALLTVPAVVVASHQFPDVPNGHPFHDEISAIAEAGITAGFMDGGYHPSDAVTRQAMAAFMERGFGHARLDAGGATATANVSANAGQFTSSSSLVRFVTVEVPGATNTFSPTQRIYLRGRVVFAANMSAANGCPCEFTATLIDVASMTSSVAGVETFESGSATAYARTVEVEAVFDVPPGSRTFQLWTRLTTRASAMSAATFPFDVRSSLGAMSFPLELALSGG